MKISEFRTKRLILKGISLEDEPSYTKHFVDYEVIRYLSRTVPWPYPENGVKHYLKNVILPKQGIDRWTWGIFLQSNPEELIGCVDLWKDANPSNRGFWLGKKYWNKGIMTEAVYPVIEFAFYDIGFKQLIFSNAAGNVGSIKIKVKTGCKLVDISSAEYVDPSFTEQELWTLSLESWGPKRARKN